MEMLINESKCDAYLNPGDGINHAVADGSWSFGNGISQIFESHVSKSVPFYAEGHDLITKLSDYFLNDASLCYEIGCSTGVLTRKIAERHASKSDFRVVGIDPVEDMIEFSIKSSKEYNNISYYCHDAVFFDYEPSDMIILYYVLQFIKPQSRLDLLKRLYSSLNDGGSLVIFEKVRESNSQHNEFLAQLYMDYKSSQGYSSDEIISKSRSLKGVLRSFTPEMNKDLLIEAGFKPENITPIMKLMQFEGYLVTK